MDLNSYEHTGHHCKLVLRLQKQGPETVTETGTVAKTGASGKTEDYGFLGVKKAKTQLLANSVH